MIKNKCIDCGITIHKTSIRCYSCNNKIIRKTNINCQSLLSRSKRRLHMLGKHLHTKEFKKQVSLRMKLHNPLHNPTTYTKFMDSIKTRNYKGKNNPNYKDGTFKIRRPRDTSEYKNWRLAVFTRDDFTCQTCHKRGGKLEAHHIKSWIKYPKLRYKINNGLTLCFKCHPRGRPCVKK